MGDPRHRASGFTASESGEFSSGFADRKACRVERLDRRDELLQKTISNELRSGSAPGLSAPPSTAAGTGGVVKFSTAFRCTTIRIMVLVRLCSRSVPAVVSRSRVRPRRTARSRNRLGQFETEQFDCTGLSDWRL